MLELCAREEGKGTREEGGDPGPRRPSSDPEAESTRAVSEPSRGKRPRVGGSRRLDCFFFFYVPAGNATHVTHVDVMG